MIRLLLVLLLLIVGCVGESRKSSMLPDRIRGNGLVESTAGEEAAEMIARLHTGRVAPVASEIGYYSSSVPPLALYASRFSSPREARDQVDLMAEMIGSGSAGFGHHQVEQMAGIDVHFVVGHGQAHYFFADGDEVFWLAAPMDVARPALLELLGEGE